jgi:hypothetical protein
MRPWMIIAALKRLVLVMLALVAFTGTAYAGEVTARVRTATCDNDNFRFRVENSSDRYRAFTVVLWNGKDEVVLKLKDKVPAWGGVRGVVSPDWNRRNFYYVEVFRTWQWHPNNQEWRQRTWLAGASARLDDC